MMYTAQAWAGDYRRLRTRLLLDRPALRGVFVERVVNTVLLKVATYSRTSRRKCPSLSGITGTLDGAASFPREGKGKRVISASLEIRSY